MLHVLCYTSRGVIQPIFRDWNLQPFLNMWRFINYYILFKEEITMISKEKKQAIMKEYARCEGDTGSPEGSSEGSSFQTWSAENGWSETWTSGIPEENRHRKIPCTD